MANLKTILRTCIFCRKKLEQKELKLPFYTRVPEIDSSWWNWFDEGNDELEEYEPHYYSLLVEANPHDKALYEIIKSGGEKVQDLLEVNQYA